MLVVNSKRCKRGGHITITTKQWQVHATVLVVRQVCNHRSITVDPSFPGHYLAVEILVGYEDMGVAEDLHLVDWAIFVSPFVELEPGFFCW